MTINLTIRSRSTSTIFPNVCNTYTTPSGKIRTASATFNDTIPNAAGCDSVITINLTIRSRSTSTISPTVCYTYTTPSGKIRTTSATFNDTIPNAAGCDSVMTINLTIRSRSASTISPNVCNTYRTPSGKIRTASATFNDTIPNAAGCDSIITINLTIRNSTTGSFSIAACNSYFFNGALRTSTGAYRDTLVNARGCDSFLTLNLTINSKLRVFNVVNCYGKSYLWNGIWRNVSGTYVDTFSTILGCDSIVILNLKIDTSKVNTQISATICAGQSYFFNNANLTVAGVYQDTFANQFGCDSFVILTLKVNSLSTTTLNVSLCNGQSYLFKGINRKTSGIYRDTLVNAFGCDSFIILNLTIHAPKIVSISKSNDSLIATSGFANYQWFKDLSLLTGQNQNVYKPSFSGTYSVNVTDSNNCSFASSGFVYVHKDPTSSISTSMSEKFNVFPNPAIDFINIESDMFAQKDCQIMVYSIDGKLVIAQEVKTRDALQTLSISDLSNGSYILRLVQGDTFKEVKFVVDK
jgi:ribosomal protein L34E